MGEQLIRDIGSYAEISPSGTGVKVLARAQLAGRGTRSVRPDGIPGGMVEVYDQGRYFTLTGHRLPVVPPVVNDAQAAITALYDALTQVRTRTATPKATTPAPADELWTPETLSDVDGAAAWARAFPHLDARILTCAAGEAVSRPDGTAYPSESERDQALMLALVRAGLTDVEAAAAFLQTERGAMLAARKGTRGIWQRLLTGAARAREWSGTDALPVWDGVRYTRLNPTVIAHGRDLGPYFVATNVILADHANHNDEAWPAQKTMAEFLDCSPTKVGEAIAQARTRGLLTYRELGFAHIHRIVYGEAPPLHLPHAAIVGMRRRGVDVVATHAAVAGLANEEGYPTREQIGACLGIPAKRVSPAVNWLVGEGHLRVAERGAGRLLKYGMPEPSR